MPRWHVRTQGIAYAGNHIVRPSEPQAEVAVDDSVDPRTVYFSYGSTGESDPSTPRKPAARPPTSRPKTAGARRGQEASATSGTPTAVMAYPVSRPTTAKTRYA